MTAKEKAIEFYNKFSNSANSYIEGKKCALIAVNEILAQWEYIDTYLADLNGELNPNLKYWQKVKQEIEKL